MPSNPNSIRLPYRYLRGQYSPVVRVHLYRNGMQAEDFALVDSGATCSIFDADVAERLGITLNAGRIWKVYGLDGRMIQVYLHRVGIRIGEFHISADIGFSDHFLIGFNLLGRHSIFNQLQFCFNDRDGELLVSRL